MGTKDWVLKGTKMILNTKTQRLKIQNRGWIFKNTILKKRRKEKTKAKQNKTKSQNYNIYISMKFALKNRLFFFFAK